MEMRIHGTHLLGAPQQLLLLLHGHRQAAGGRAHHRPHCIDGNQNHLSEYSRIVAAEQLHVLSASQLADALLPPMEPPGCDPRQQITAQT